ncbi:RidA family protein [Algoriphagus sp. SE2]|uniref:RidA family protein n=1 Tax=Algoriphagus sp. SE2 TaxID=3141536 RepID=UPI0031CD00A4
MKNPLKSGNQTVLILPLFILAVIFQNCQPKVQEASQTSEIAIKEAAEKPEYFYLRPEVEKAYGYTHAVKIGNDIKISGAVSMDDEGNPTAIGNMEEQMKNCYADLGKILKHFGATFDDVIVENVFTTDMPTFLEASVYRNSIYTKQFPTGSWLGVKDLALPELMIEIELEVHLNK